LKSYPKRFAIARRLGFTPQDAIRLARLKTPSEIQTFINSIPPNFEAEGDTCLSASEALQQKRAHCIEAAFIAAAVLWMMGEPPLLMDFQAEKDDDHVVALFRRNGCWGAISKSNHVWLRWRDPVYRSLRELAMSYFHDYFGKNRRNLRAYSAPFDLRRIDSAIWVGGKESCWDLATIIDESRHYTLINKAQARQLRVCDQIETEANKLTEHRNPRNMRKNKAKRKKLRKP
jgi:hypothetical protein